MKESKVKSNKIADLNLLPIMNLFSVLIVFLLSVAIYEKLGILELTLPERTDAPKQASNVDPNLLNLSIVVGHKGITIGAAAGFQPTVFYFEEVEYRSTSDKHVFRKPFVKDEKVFSPTDGRLMTLQEKETIFLHAIEKKDEADPGTFKNVVVGPDDNALLDTAGNWYTTVPAVGQEYRLIGDQVIRKMDPQTAAFCKVTRLSAYQEISRQLEQVNQVYRLREPMPPDVDDVVILAEDDIIYDKVIQVMDAAKAAGYDRVALSLMGGT